MTRAGRVVDSLLEATNAGSFSRAGITIRSRPLARVHHRRRALARRAASTRRQIIAESGNSSVSYEIADLDSVTEFARDFVAGHDRLDVLIQNAGAMHERYQVNGADLELTFAVQARIRPRQARLGSPERRVGPAHTGH
jgi:NAD(P)-dependent dehydrogenase (short-subunit alcohol dehydrogenase family)